MALFSRITATGTGSPQTLSVPPYLSKDHISVFVNNVLTFGYTWLTAQTISLAAPAGSAVMVQRNTSPDARLVNYQDGQGLPASNLNADSLQAFYLAQEALDSIQLTANGGAVVVPVGGGGSGDLETRLGSYTASTGAALVAYSGTAAYPADTVGKALHDLIAAAGSGAVGTPFIHVKAAPYNAVGGGAGGGADAAKIQAAINAADTAGGGVVWLGTDTYDLGTTGLVGKGNVVVMGASARYAGGTTRGTTLKYGGTGQAYKASKATNSFLMNVAIDCTTATGTAVIGAYMEDTWLSGLINVAVRGATPSKGYGVLFSNNDSSWYSQHNQMVGCECADGIIRFSSKVVNSLTPGADILTTMRVDTCRGYKYECDNAQVTFINATAEQWTTGNGFTLVGPGTQVLLLGCDIENTLTTVTGIAIGGGATVREQGTVWAGFAGTSRVVGNMAPLLSYGGPFQFIYSGLTVGTPVPVTAYGDRNVPAYVKQELVPVNVTGGSQDGYLRTSRMLQGTSGLSTLTVVDDPMYHMRLKSAVNGVAPAAPTLIGAIFLPVSAACCIRITAFGSQPGNKPYCKTVEIVAANISGTIQWDVGADHASGTLLATNVFTCSNGGSNTLNVYHQNGGSAAGYIGYTWDITGNISGHSLVNS